MAGLIRLGVLRGCDVGKMSLRRSINTSPKCRSSEKPPAKPDENKNWISYGYSDRSLALDRFGMHLINFISLSVLFCGGAVYAWFWPDPRNKEWAQREAYLELRRREALGLPPIDPNYFDPDTIILPTDEELGDTEIII